MAATITAGLVARTGKDGLDEPYLTADAIDSIAERAIELAETITSKLDDLVLVEEREDALPEAQR